MKKRADVLLVEQGLAESRAQAQALVLAGLVPGVAKPGQQLDEATALEVERLPQYVSRGGDKLANALDALELDVRGRHALDVGYGQLHPRLRGDARVIVLERTNARAVTELPFPPDLIVCDVSFISVRTALPPLLRLAQPGWEGVVLVKPQFEAGRADVGKGGVVRDPEVRRRVVREVAEAALGWQGRTVAAVDSGVPGPKGNREVFLHLVHDPEARLPDDIDDRIARAVP